MATGVHNMQMATLVAAAVVHSPAGFPKSVVMVTSLNDPVPGHRLRMQKGAASQSRRQGYTVAMVSDTWRPIFNKMHYEQ
jgi:hypothetical protein